MKEFGFFALAATIDAVVSATTPTPTNYQVPAPTPTPTPLCKPCDADETGCTIWSAVMLALGLVVGVAATCCIMRRFNSTKSGDNENDGDNASVNDNENDDESDDERDDDNAKRSSTKSRGYTRH